MTFKGPPHQNTRVQAPARQRPHLSPPLRSSHSWRIGPAVLLGAQSNPRLAPEGPLPRSLVPKRWGLEIPEPQCLTHPATPPQPGLLGAPPVIQGGEWGGPAESLETFEGPWCQNAWAHTPAQQSPHLVPPFHSLHSWQIEPAGVLGANPNARSAPRGAHPKGPGATTRWIGEP